MLFYLLTHTHTYAHSGRNKPTECHCDKNMEFNMYNVEDR